MSAIPPLQRHFMEEVAEDGIPSIHSHAMGWHAVRLDENTIYGVMVGSAAVIDRLEEQGHPTITIMPSLADPGDVHQHLRDKGKDKHSKMLKDKHSVPPSVTMHGLAKHMSKRFKHPYFKPHF